MSIAMVDGRSLSTEPVVHQGAHNRSTGLDWAATRTPVEAPIVPITDPAPKEPTMTTTPAYITEFSNLMRDTEGHPDVFVRQVRKIITQTALTLKTAYDATEGATGAPVSPAALSAVPDSAAIHAQIIKVPKVKKTKAVKPAGAIKPNVVNDLLTELGVTAADVRAWAVTTGLPISLHGRLGIAIVEDYANTHPKVA